MEKDLENYTTDGTCPHCGGDSFSSDTPEVSPGEYLNTCSDCGEKSIWANDKQYKIK